MIKPRYKTPLAAGKWLADNKDSPNLRSNGFKLLDSGAYRRAYTHDAFPDIVFKVGNDMMNKREYRHYGKAPNNLKFYLAHCFHCIDQGKVLVQELVAGGVPYEDSEAFENSEVFKEVERIRQNLWLYGIRINDINHTNIRLIENGKSVVFIDYAGSQDRYVRPANV